MRDAIIKMLVNSLGWNGYSRSCAIPKQITLHHDQLEQLVNNIEGFIINELQTNNRRVDSSKK